MKKQIPLLLDCRALVAFAAGHHRNAGHIPASELSQAMHLLPEPSIPLILMGDQAALDQSRSFLLEKGYVVERSILLTSSIIQQWQGEGLWVTEGAAMRLWQPSPLVHLFVDDLMAKHQIVAKNGLEIACGSGRDAVFLAMHGWRMTAIDVQAAAVARARNLAASQGVALDGVVKDLEKGSDPFADFADGSFSLVNVARYLHRPLFPFIQRLIAHDGVILYHTFMVGSEAFGSPKNPNFLLASGELAAVFSDFTILLDEVVTLSDGRPMSLFLARK